MKKIKWGDLTRAQRKRYVDQDQKNQCEITIDFFDRVVLPDVWKYTKKEFSSLEMKKTIILLHIDGKTISEINYHFPCSHQYISRIIREWKVGKIKL
jgi:hypothetical protein